MEKVSGGSRNTFERGENIATRIDFFVPLFTGTFLHVNYPR